MIKDWNLLSASSFPKLVSLEDLLTTIVPILGVIRIRFPVPLMFQTLQDQKEDPYQYDSTVETLRVSVSQRLAFMSFLGADIQITMGSRAANQFNLIGNKLVRALQTLKGKGIVQSTLTGRSALRYQGAEDIYCGI